MKKIFFSVVAFFMFSVITFSKIAVMGAMDEEIDLLKKGMKDVKETKIGRIVYYEGNLDGKEIVLFKSGVGKVNATIGADVAIREFKVDKIIFTGIAGAIDKNLNIADIVIAKGLVQHDFDCTAFGSPLGLVEGEKEVIFKSSKELIEIARKAAINVVGEDRVKLGIIATGDQFITDRKKVQKIGAIFNAKAVEMEGAAVAQVSQIYGIPFVVLRSISDKADDSSHMDYPKFKIIAANNSARIVKLMLKNI